VAVSWRAPFPHKFRPIHVKLAGEIFLYDGRPAIGRTAITSRSQFSCACIRNGNTLLTLSVHVVNLQRTPSRPLGDSSGTSHFLTFPTCRANYLSVMIIAHFPTSADCFQHALIQPYVMARFPQCTTCRAVIGNLTCPAHLLPSVLYISAFLYPCTHSGLSSPDLCNLNMTLS
jgi:hypothetical protein